MKRASNLQIIRNDNGEKYKMKRSRARYMFIKKNRRDGVESGRVTLEMTRK